MLKISIIIPVYGVEQYIERCCVSVFEQTYNNFEIIFVNDCSKDKSADIVFKVIEQYKHLDISTTIIKHEINKGISATRETGLNAATGEYVLYIDSDDYIAPNMLELLISRAKETDADIVYCDYYDVKNGTQIYQDQSLQVNDPLLITAAMLHGDIRWCPWNKLFRRSITLEHSIHWPVGINVGEDLAVIPRIFYYANRVEHVDQGLYFYNRDNVNSYLNGWNASSCYQNIKAVESINNFFNHQPHNPDLIKALDQTKLMTRYLMLYSFDDELIKSVADKFPETNDKIFSYEHTSKYWKVALYLTIRKQTILAWLALKTIWWFKKLRSCTAC
jgi:glycosyltransferase involved in cell wall biosynthesis